MGPTRPPGQVLINVVTKNIERTADHASNSIGVRAGSTAVDRFKVVLDGRHQIAASAF